MVGSDEFRSTLPEQIHDGTFKIEVAANVNEAQSWLETVKPPDVLMVQASLDGAFELCRWLKQQTKLIWIYCILLEDRLQIIPERSLASWNREFELTAAALEESADAYVWLVQGEGIEDYLIPSHRLLLGTSRQKIIPTSVPDYRKYQQTICQDSVDLLAPPGRLSVESDFPP